ncbi:MAG: MBL fold metallo-hydrolase, partial [Candidatus Sumerlaeia bacterium]|nr:MBL fold metallo-hydrolase [Candidatus Sumerlaeia bacterium]
LTHAELNGALWLGIRYQSIAPDILIEHGDQLTVGSYNLEVIHTPGHSPGSISLFMKDVLFSGDLLFKQGVGRWDLPGGDEKQLFNSLRQVLQLPETTVVYPGHGPKTTIAEEQVYNPYINNGHQFL